MGPLLAAGVACWALAAANAGASWRSVDLADHDLFGPTGLVIDGAGHPAATWQGSTGQFLAGGSFAGPITSRSLGASSTDPSPQLVAAGGDTVLVKTVGPVASGALPLAAGVRPAGGALGRFRSLPALDAPDGVALGGFALAGSASGVALVVVLHRGHLELLRRAPGRSGFGAAHDLGSARGVGPLLLDDDGQGAVAWPSRDGHDRVVFISRTGAVGTAHRLPDGDDLNDLRLGNGGAAVIPVHLLRHSAIVWHRPGLGGFGPLHPAPALYALALDDHAHALAAWKRGGRLLAARAGLGHGFAPPHELAAKGSKPFGLRLIGNAAGDAVLTWREGNLGSPASNPTYVSSSARGGRLTDPTMIADRTFHRTNVNLDPNGRAAFAAGGCGEPSSLAAWTAGAQPGPLRAIGPVCPDGFWFDSAADGTTMLAWLARTPGQAADTLLATVRAPGGAFSPVEDLGADEGGNAADLSRITAAPDGRAAVLWRHTSGSQVDFGDATLELSLSTP